MKHSPDYEPWEIGLLWAILLILILIGLTSNRAHAATYNVQPWDNVQSVINSSQVGDTIHFYGVTYNLSAQVTLKGNRTYVGDAGAVIYSRFADHAFRVSETNTTIKGFVFDGAGVRIDAGNAVIDGPVIDNCTFHVRNIAPSAHVGVIFENSNTVPHNMKITNCVFDPIEGDAGIYGYTFNGLTIANCLFQNGTGPAADGVHLSSFGNAKNLLIEQVYGKDLRRNFLELQGAFSNVTVQDNWYEWIGSIPFQPGDGTFMYSLPMQGSNGTLMVRQNVSLAPLSTSFPDKIGPRIVFELGGTNLQFINNYSRGANHVLAATGAGGSGIAKDNNIDGYREGPRTDNGNTTQFVNNGPLVKLPVDLIGRGRPTTNRRFGDLSVQSLPTTTPTTVPATQPATVPTTVPTTVPLTKSIVKTTLTWTITYSDGSTEVITRP